MGAIEAEFVQWLGRRQRAHPAVKLGIGDDMAVIRGPSGDVLVSSDILLDGVHFESTRHDLRLIGRKAVACGLSDCAAMAVEPLAITVSVALPRAWDLHQAQRLFGGVHEIAEEFGIAVVGGDTTTWDNPLAIDVTIIARPVEGIVPVTRSGAKIGDRLYVTGALGGSLLGRHLTFTPRVREATALARTLGEHLHAMIDISDGLALDLSRLCAASGVGAAVDEALLAAIVSEDARHAAGQDGVSPLDHALGDGEDFELLAAIQGDADGAPAPLLPIGEITASELSIRRADGTVAPLEPKGYLH